MRHLSARSEPAKTQFWSSHNRSDRTHRRSRTRTRRKALRQALLQNLCSGERGILGNAS